MQRDRTFTKQAFTKANWKTKRRIMRSFKINEISAVDTPAQEGARVLMMKRAPDPAAPSTNDSPIVMAKAAFADIFNEEKTEQAVCRAFYDAMDDRWLADDSFREALKDAQGDAQTSADQYVAAVRVMADKAVAAVRDARAGGAIPDDESMKSEVAKAIKGAEISFAKHVEEKPMFKTLAELIAAIEKYASGDRSVSKADLRKAAIDLDAVDKLTGELALAQPDPEVASLKRQVAELSMTPDVRKHYDGLDDAGKTAFLAKSADQQAAEVAAANTDDPVVYTAKDGTQVRKSDGAMAVMMAKNFDALNGRMDKLEKGHEANTFEKRAQTEFPYLPTASTVALLKSAAALTDEESAPLIAGLRLANKAAKPRFQTLGNGGDVTKSFVDDSGAEAAGDKLDELAKSIMAKSKDAMTYEQAYAKAITSPEGRALYNETVGFEPSEA